ncbi:uncharacterized protein KGF55_005036 [Candida pseudojiufengensis]|uniref:uncharacterized protein n=1 Tax=Candida pseudojiufengensis TaxID=497109 RepID=UPI002224ACC6|nr:uncharacterized protein KGF55_005036 [Candida pseudojiufengensis]KAI5959804.1 hypothetical protein KGF55_005036 [Candida pseudojiufengensis]
MLKENYKDLAKKAQKIYQDSLSETLKIVKFDEELTKKYESLPSAIGKTTEEFGNPTKFPFELYLKTVPSSVLAITEKDPIELLKDLKTRKITCVEVLKAYFTAAIIASKLVNCIVEFLPKEALEFAENLDKQYDSKKDLPMYGLPFSIKEMIPFKNRAVTHGSLCYLDRIVDYNADIINILMNQGGAYPFVRTTNPQSLMMLECVSLQHGRTVNPFNSELTSGGSSGGEGALNGLYASTFGLGSDIGGSIRTPAGFNGIYGLRTTLGRIPTADYFSCNLGSTTILSVTGPISRSLGMVDLVMKTIIDSKPELIDPSLTSIPWKESEQNQKKYRIGILKSDGIVNPSPPVLRALDIIENKLKKLPNVEVVEYHPFKQEKVMEILSKIYFEDGAKDFHSTVKDTGEPILEQTKWAIEGATELSMHDQWYWNLEKEKFRKEYLKHWISYKDSSNHILDAVIAPIYPNVAPKHGQGQYWNYTCTYNLLDYPVLVVPITIVDQNLDLPKKNYKPLNEMDEFHFKCYDSPKSFEKAPVNLSVIGLRNTDEKLIEIGKIIQNEIGDIFNPNGEKDNCPIKE